MRRRLSTPLFASFLLAAAPACAQTSDAPSGGVEKVTVRAIAHFDFDRTTVLPADQKRLLSEVATLKDVSWKAVSAEGFADSTGSADYNRKLSLRRAEAVRSYLVGQGIASSMIATDGKGADAPVADNASAEGRAQNRRTEVTFEGVRSVAAR